jgi:hypothetical protein
MEHKVYFERGHDCIKFECINDSKRCFQGSGGSHGVHGLTIQFVSTGEKGAVQFALYTGWLPQYKSKDGIGYRSIDKWGTLLDMLYPMPADLGCHSRTPMYEDQKTMPCQYLDGADCYYDGSGLNATDAMYALVNGGDVALWTFLDAYYECVFNEGKYPEPAEYPKPMRGLTAQKEGV